MDKFINLFIKSKPKDNDSDSKVRKPSIITTQNLENFANINQSGINNLNTNQIQQTSQSENNKKFNFTGEDFEDIDKKANINDENFTQNKNDILNEINPDIQAQIKANPQINRTQPTEYNNKINSLSVKSNPVGDIVMVNTLDNVKKPIDGFYSLKYKEKFQALKSVN
jgi:hypothetical protein